MPVPPTQMLAAAAEDNGLASSQMR